MSNKKRILFIGEASNLSTGFSTYYRELIPRLVATGKYEIAELGSYVRQDDPKVQEFIQGRWKFYGVMPTTQEEAQAFNAPNPHPRTRGQNTNQFGEYKFNHVCADFKPDIVIDIRDWWMLEFQERSVFRSWFKWVVMPTVDAEPQAEEWMKTYENAEMVLAYSDYGVHTLRRQSQLLPNGKKSVSIFPKAMRPGVDLETFLPMDTKETREHWNLNSDNPVIGTVMRNQSRKLYPDLIDGFAAMKEKYKGEDAVDKAVLLIHSSWPDNAHSYDYPRHIMRLESYDWMPYASKGIRGSILQSMYCHAASPPNTAGGFTREDLAKLYNLMDLYVQCSICEGDGMPIQEAKACGVPTLVTDYTAMREKGRFPDYNHFEDLKITEDNYTCTKGGDVIDVGRYYHEPETGCIRAHPDVDDLADKMRNMITDPVKLKALGIEARECTEENYDWNKLWKQWEYVLDNIKPLDRSQTWDSPIIEHDSIQAVPVPDGLSDEQYVEWLYINVLKYPAVDPEGAKTWIQHLGLGVPREQIMKQFVAIGNQQSDGGKLRDQIRQEVAGIAPVAQRPTQEFI